MKKRRFSNINKKGFELVWSNLVIMILAILLAAILIIFLTVGSKGFGDYIKGFFGYSNVDNVVNSCNLLVQSNSQYAFCCEKKNVKYYDNGEKLESEFSCFELLNKRALLGKDLGEKLNSLDCSGGCG